MPELNVSTTVSLTIKIAAVVGLSIYSIFAFIIIKQVNLMTQTLEVDLEKAIKGVAVAHFIFSICVLVYALLM
jgi:hypothetical protein